LVDWVPERAAASWAVTTWWSTRGWLDAEDGGLEVDGAEFVAVHVAAGDRAAQRLGALLLAGGAQRAAGS